MSVASSGSNTKAAVHDQNASRTQSQQEQQAKNEAQAKAFQKASTPTGNTGTGYGGGRITFDKSGNTLQDGKIVQFAGRQAQESYLAERGFGNNGIILDQAKAAKADFSNLQQANKYGVIGQEQPLGGFGWNWGGNVAGGRQITRGSSLEQQIQQKEADKASQVYGSFSNPDYATGGAKPSDKTVVSLDNAQSFFGKTQSGEYGWKDIGKNQLVRGSKQEEQAKQSEAEKVFTGSPSKSNADYITGGTPEKTSGGVITAKSFGKSAGWSVLAPDQLSRNSPKETQVKENEAVKASAFVKDTSKQGYDTSLVGLTDTNANQGTSSLAFISRGKPLTEQQVQDKNSSIALGNGLISLSNKQVAAKNISSDKEFRDYLHKGTEQGAVFSFFVGDKKVGETSGARSYHDYLSARQKYGNNVSVGENFPSREKTLSEAVQKNTAFYSGLSQPYWDALSKAGYFSEKNQGKINEQINLYGKVQSREALASGQGILPAMRFGGEIPVGGGRTKIIGPEQNEVASFMKFPFAGQKTSTSFLKSTSYSDILQFYPGIPGLGKALAPASEVWINLIGKGQNKFGEIKTGIETKVRTGIGGNAMEGAINYPKPIPEVSVRPTNMKDLEFVGSQIEKQTMGRRPETVTETSLRTSPKVKENPDYQPSTNVFNPRPQPNFDINFKTETPVFRKTEYTSNALSPQDIAILTRYPKSSAKYTEPDLSGPRSTPPSSSKSFLKNKGPLPFIAVREAGSSQVSPISREFIGSQFQGNPSNFAETQPLFSTAWVSKTTSKPIVNLEERGDYQDFRFRKFLQRGNTEARFGFSIAPKRENVNLPEQKDYQDFRYKMFESSKQEESIFDILSQTLPKKSEQLQNYPQLPEKPEDLIQAKAVKGGQYGAKSPINLYSTSSGFSENPKDVREFLGLAGERVTGKTSGKLPLEKFNLIAQGGIKEGDIVGINPTSGTYLRKYSDVSILNFGPKTGAGPLDIQVIKSLGGSESRGFTEGKGIFGNAKGSKYYASEEVYPYGSSFIRGSLKTKDVGLAKFEKYQKNNPEPEKVGSKRFDLFTSKLPKGNKKAPVFNNLVNLSEKGKTFKSSSSKLFEEKKPEPKKGTEFKNVGSKTETVLIQRPQIRRRVITASEQQYDYGYEFKPVPSSKSDTSLISGIMSGLKTGTLPGYKTGSKVDSGSLFANLNKNLTGILPKSNYRQSPRQTERLFIGQEEKQTPKSSFKLFQSPKQGTSPKQAQSYKPVFPTPQTPKQSLIQPQTQPTRTPTQQISKNPKPKPIIPLLFGSVGRKRSGKNKSGPTGLINLNVNNVFSSGLSIHVGKNRVEF